MDSLAVELLAKAKELSPPDEVRHPIIIDHNDTIHALAFAAHVVVDEFGDAAAPAVRVVAESLFTLGYLQALEDAKHQPDESIWNF